MSVIEENLLLSSLDAFKPFDKISNTLKTIELFFMFQHNIRPTFINRKEGFTLLEMLLVLSLIAFLTLSLFWLYHKVQTQRIMTEESKNIGFIFGQINNLSSASNGVSNFSWLTVTDPKIVAKNIFPSDMIWTDGLPYSQFDPHHTQPVTLLPDPSDPEEVELTYPSMDTEDCQKLPPAVAPNLIDLLVDGHSMFQQKKLQISALIQACENGPHILTMVNI